VSSIGKLRPINDHRENVFEILFSRRGSRVKIDDYTALPLGTKTKTGEIMVCPECGKHGLREISGNKEFFTHYQRTGWDVKTGNPNVDWLMHDRPLESAK
jgi:hypothetical protein